ncbi:MAG: polysaccharide biosynthesis C-terminal domain-containing protein [Terriglobales bacterium]
MSELALPKPTAPEICGPAGKQSRMAGWQGGPSALRLRKLGYSSADQVLAIGGMFVVNLALARARSREEYGIFTLSYSVFTFLAGLYNAALLEAYTIYGSGRYHGSLRAYEKLLWRANAWFSTGLTALLLSVWLALHWLFPALASPALLGMGLTCGALLTASFRRRTFYIQRRPDLALRYSSVFFAACVGLLALAMRLGWLNGLSAFVIAALAWGVAALFTGRDKAGRDKAAGDEAGETVAGDASDFLADIPDYWREHWKYSRWVLVTALVFQFTGQAYFWVVAAFLSLKDVAELRAMYNLVQPVEQGFVAVTLLVLPQMALQFAAGETTKLRRMWRQCSLAFAGMSSAFALIVGVGSLRWLHLLYGGKFDDAAPLLRWYVLLPVVMGLGHAANAALKATEKPKAVFHAYLASGAITFVLGVPLVMRWGVRGAVFGMLLSAAGYAAATGFSLCRSIRAASLQQQLANACHGDA